VVEPGLPDELAVALISTLHRRKPTAEQVGGQGEAVDERGCRHRRIVTL